MKNIFNRFKLNFRTICKQTGILTALFYSFLGLISTWCSLGDLIPSELTSCQKVLASVIILISIMIACFIGSLIYVMNSTKVKVVTSRNGHSVWLHYGDMYSSDIVKKGYQDRINIVIPVNRCFDTIVDNDLVSENSNHGRAMKKLYDQGYNETSLNIELQQMLANCNYEPEQILTVQEKRKGNLKRYPVGTVAELEVSDKLTYFLLGISKFDQYLKASTSRIEFVESVQKLIEFCDTRSQGFPVVLPLLGTGLSRANISKQEALDYLVSAFKMNENIINCDFHIVVWTGDKDTVTIRNV